MPKELENKFKKQYGKDNPVVFKIMNKLGFMKGPNETAKGEALDKSNAKRSNLDSKSKAHMVSKFIRKGN